MTPFLKSTTLCDDFRIENNGKYIIIGGYPGDVISSQRPALLQFSLVMNFEGQNDGPIPIEIRTEGGPIPKFQKFDVLFSNGSAVLVIKVAIALLQERDLSVHLRWLESDWQYAGKWALAFSPDAATTDPETSKKIETLYDNTFFAEH